MSTRRTRPERISAKRAELIQVQNELKRLEREEKDAEQKARTKRFCKRSGFIESILPEMKNLSDERFEIFAKRHIANSYGVKALNELLKEQEKEDNTHIEPEPAPEATKSAQTQSTAPEKAPPSPYIEDDDVESDDYV